MRAPCRALPVWICWCAIGAVLPCANTVVTTTAFQSMPSPGGGIGMGGGAGRGVGLAGEAARSIIASARELMDYTLGKGASLSKGRADGRGQPLEDMVGLARQVGELLNESDALQSQILDFATQERALMQLERGYPDRPGGQHRDDALLLGASELEGVLMEESRGGRRACRGGLHDVLPGATESDGLCEDEEHAARTRPILVRHRSARDDVVAVSFLRSFSLSP